MEDWRRIDIDAFDPEARLRPEDLVPNYGTTITLSELQPKISQLRSLASSGDMSSAIQLATSEPPYSADEQTKHQYFLAVLEALAQTRQTDMAKVVKSLDRAQKDVLVKYIYKGMSLPEGKKQGGILLAWFENLTQDSGVNPIVHYISDRRTV
ncbi:hypothetical protein TPHA_0K00860 [Tetrapisispora phaffii CBS 4417]|uniref:Actin-related protein 2/3 complex subunit 5 n=1 Tax=Tetrapisispora phaffii (strain ATCC 24235 / CBS 4417 / NBRC 1672 / NRRL Y-8282 / UCD 70-5) TaxID=1071381 RepID=G8BZ92_TETPH|nr:hypothetical protein TPHA_0K00860 [Tetrapisispora phaffii CBS 4417]CCE65220.1 hypothetical protein TPHA_0K00860 [Tetrapisispora phaffii CBS 4417]